MLIISLLAAATVPASESSAIFTAAGFKLAGKEWRTDCYQPDGGSYEPGQLESYGDLNGDGRPEAIVTEGGTFCYGNTGTGFWLLSKQASGKWKVLYQSQGIAEFMKSVGADKMPDISVGGPGFCFPVVRWDGREFRVNRHQYEGKPCRPRQ
jgi:hypothetical protein